MAASIHMAAFAGSAEEILEDPSIQLIINAGIPCERAPLGLRAMQHGKDYMTDKPGMTTFAQLEEVRRVQAETGRIYSVDFSERFHVRAAVKAGELIQAGAIGRVLQVTILAPHQARLADRPCLVLRAGEVRRHPGGHRLTPIRPDPLLHRLRPG